MSEMITVSGVTKRFGDFKALDNINMHVKKGSVYGLVGPNGAGKSTIIRHLTGVYRQDEGEVQIAGESVYENASVKSKYAYVPDDIFYYAIDNAIDQMKLYKGLYPRFDEKLFYELKSCFPEVDLKKNIRNLSKGMQKQVSFMLSIAARPEVLILDEPVDGLDPVIRRQIWSILMQDVAEHDVTVLVSSHNLRELEDVCDHVGIMSHGKLILEKTLDDLQSDITKAQVAFSEEGVMNRAETDLVARGIEVQKTSTVGKVHTFIMKGNRDVAINTINSLNPILVDVLPLSLEEIFIYELGGEDYAVKDIIF